MTTTSTTTGNQNFLIPEKSKEEFAAFLRKQRHKLGLSLMELEGRTGIHNSRISRWERGIEMPNRPERLTALAKGLEIPPSDLYLLAGIELAAELPSMKPYLRTKYHGQLPPRALAKIEAFTKQIASEYGITSFEGPAPGEDE